MKIDKEVIFKEKMNQDNITFDDFDKLIISNSESMTVEQSGKDPSEWFEMLVPGILVPREEMLSRFCKDIQLDVK